MAASPDQVRARVEMAPWEKEFSMRANLRDIIEELKIEKSILQDGGYGRSVRTPWKENQLFHDSISCLNYGLGEKIRPCSDHFLWEWAPPEHRDDEFPCHYIPLNDRGDTIHSLELAGDREGAERALIAWLGRTIEMLEGELAREESEARSLKH
jgi:hypothetical protein